MDGRRFDAWTKGLATGASRRRLLGGLTGAATLLVAGARRATAQDLLAAGEACTATEQCSQAGGATVCADNYIAEDGPLNCCRIEGGACGRPNDCCGLLNCVDGVCVDGATAAAAEPTPTAPAPAAGGDLPLGAACQATTECAAVTGGIVVCGDNGIEEDGPLNCCLEERSACEFDSDCCGVLFCTDGFCGSPPDGATSVGDTAGGGDLAPGQFCVTSAECSQALGPAICASNATAGAPVCCLREASACTTDQECCGDAVCADNGISADGGLNCCGYAGAACTADAGCCADLFCLDGTCQPLA